MVIYIQHIQSNLRLNLRAYLAVVMLEKFNGWYFKIKWRARDIYERCDNIWLDMRDLNCWIKVAYISIIFFVSILQ